MVAYTLKRAKEKGMEAFITYRMNDLHFNDTTTHCPIRYTDLRIQHPEYWLNDTTQGYNSGGAFDFAIKEVRDRKLAIISEQLENYADIIDGYDLDFMRFIVYFKSGTGPQNAPLMTQLVKDIRQKVDEISAKQGRKILLSARVAPTVEQNMMKGLDIREWLRLGLLDFISTGVHWRGDPAMPVAKFREEMGERPQHSVLQFDRRRRLPPAGILGHTACTGGCVPISSHRGQTGSTCSIIISARSIPNMTGNCIWKTAARFAGS